MDDGAAITVANADGSNAHEVGRGLGAQQLSWSPDGARLVFIGEPSDTAGTPVSILDLTTGEVTTLLAADAYLWNQIAWAPDGKQIALAGTYARPDSPPDSRYDIYLLPLDGGALEPLKTDLNYTEYMDWSPDGTQLALQRRQFPVDKRPGRLSVGHRDHQRRRLGVHASSRTGPAGTTSRCGRPIGEWIAFSSDRDASAAQLEANASADATTFGGAGTYVMRPDGTDVRPVLVAGDGDAVIATSWKA